MLYLLLLYKNLNWLRGINRCMIPCCPWTEKIHGTSNNW